MSKALVNQRLVFKINSSRFRENDWNITMSMKEAKINEEIVALGDSIALRMIRDIRNNKVTEKHINATKLKIKKIKKKPNTEENRLKIKNCYELLTSQTLIDDYLIIVFDTIFDWNTANSKKTQVILNGKEYVRLLGTSGGIKKNAVVFCAKDIHKELDDRLNNGRDTTQKYVPAKFEAYKSLACSSSTPITQPKNVLVIKDGEVNFKADVLRLSDNGDGGFNLDEVDGYDINRAFTDGCGMIDPELSKQWTIDLTGNTYMANGEECGSTGYNIRNSWTKGMVFTFPFKEYAESIGEYMVEDAWGNMIDIREVDLVITTNMLKLWGAYKSYKHFNKCCKKNGFEYCVAKILPEVLEPIRNMNYQFLQSYELDDKDIDELIKPTIDTIKGAYAFNEGDYAKMLLFLKGNNITYKDFVKEESNHMKALMINPSLAKDPLITQKVSKMIYKRINDAKKGVIQVNGNYQIVSGDLYALCQFMFKKEVTGLLKANQFYSNEWNKKGVDKVVAYRAPMTIHNNIVIMRLANNEEVNKWYRYMRTCIVLNAWDTAMDDLNGMDFDGDAVITTDNEVLLRNTKELKTVVCEQQSAEKHIISESNLKKANKNGFGNDVGGITNKCTAMFDVLAKFEKGSDEYNEMLYRITCMQGYQQEIIDSCKGIIPKEVPKYWYNYKENKITDEDDEEAILIKQKNISMLSDKKPYFFIYNYPYVKQQYKSYLKNHQIVCGTNFGYTIEDLMVKENKTDEEIAYLNTYRIFYPVSNNESTMNKICHRIEREIDDMKNKIKEFQFDKNVIKTKKKIDKNVKMQIEQLYEEHKENIRRELAKNKNISKEEQGELRGMYYSLLSENAHLICNNDEDLCNIFIDILYDTTNGKHIIWTICGEYIVDKMLKENDNTINIPTMSSDGEIEWCGYKFTNNKIRVEGEEC